MDSRGSQKRRADDSEGGGGSAAKRRRDRKAELKAKDDLEAPDIDFTAYSDHETISALVHAAKHNDRITYNYKDALAVTSRDFMKRVSSKYQGKTTLLEFAVDFVRLRYEHVLDIAAGQSEFYHTDTSKADKRKQNNKMSRAKDSHKVGLEKLRKGIIAMTLAEVGRFDVILMQKLVDIVDFETNRVKKDTDENNYWKWLRYGKRLEKEVDSDKRNKILVVKREFERGDKVMSSIQKYIDSPPLLVPSIKKLLTEVFEGRIRVLEADLPRAKRRVELLGFSLIPTIEAKLQNEYAAQLRTHNVTYNPLMFVDEDNIEHAIAVCGWRALYDPFKKNRDAERDAGERKALQDYCRMMQEKEVLRLRVEALRPLDE
jgi:hypothetical protein